MSRSINPLKAKFRRPKWSAGWTAERRARLALRNRAHKPWTSSTGPKTAHGKAISAVNARTHGTRSASVVAELRRLRELLRGCRRTSDLVNAYVRDANRRGVREGQGLALSFFDDSIEKSTHSRKLE